MPPAVSSEEDDFSGADDGPVITKSPAPRTPGRKAKEVPLPALDVEEEEAEVPSNDEDNGGDDQDNDDDEEDDNDDDDDDDDEQDEEEYVVEAIVNYRKNRDTIIYEVKWKNYDERDNTWEPEENLEGAKDALKAFWRKIGGHPAEIEANKSKEKKKRGRKSASSANTPDAPSKRMKTEVPVRKGRLERSSNKSEDEEDKLDWPTSQSDWAPPKVAKDSWEDKILSLEAIDQRKVGKVQQLWAFVKWVEKDDNGECRMSKVLLESVHQAAPQAALRFYQDHLTFMGGNGKR